MYSMLDDMLEKAKMVADIATKKTGEAVEISKYKVEALRLNSHIKHLHEQLGSAIYSMTKHDYDNPDLIESLTDEIDETLLVLEAVNEKISELKNLARCTVCGAKNTEENFYCCRCGSKIKTNFDNEFYENSNGERMTHSHTDCGCGDGCDCGDDCNCGDGCGCGDDCGCACNVTPEPGTYPCTCGDDCGCDDDDTKNEDELNSF